MLRNQLLNQQLIEYLIPLLKCGHKPTVIGTLKCLKVLFTRNDAKCAHALEKFKAMNGGLILETIYEVDALAEELLITYIDVK
jgi:hypothetical protein